MPSLEPIGIPNESELEDLLDSREGEGEDGNGDGEQAIELVFARFDEDEITVNVFYESWETFDRDNTNTSYSSATQASSVSSVDISTSTSDPSTTPSPTSLAASTSPVTHELSTSTVAATETSAQQSCEALSSKLLNMLLVDAKLIVSPDIETAEEGMITRFSPLQRVFGVTEALQNRLNASSLFTIDDLLAKFDRLEGSDDEELDRILQRAKAIVSIIELPTFSTTTTTTTIPTTSAAESLPITTPSSSPSSSSAVRKRKWGSSSVVPRGVPTFTLNRTSADVETTTTTTTSSTSPTAGDTTATTATIATIATISTLSNSLRNDIAALVKEDCVLEQLNPYLPVSILREVDEGMSESESRSDLLFFTTYPLMLLSIADIEKRLVEEFVYNVHQLATLQEDSVLVFYDFKLGEKPSMSYQTRLDSRV